MAVVTLPRTTTAKNRGKRDNPSHVSFTQQLKPEFWDWVDSPEAERIEKDGTIVTNRLGLTKDQAVDLITRPMQTEDPVARLEAVRRLGDELLRRLEYTGSLFLYDKRHAGLPLTDWEAEEDAKHEGSRIFAAYIVLHDKDTYLEKDDAGHEVECAKEPHVHCVVTFEPEQRSGRKVYLSAPPAYLAKRLGIPDHHVDGPQYETKGGERTKKGGPTFEWPGFPGRVGMSADNKLSYLTHAKYEKRFQYPPEEVITLRGPDYLPIDKARRPDWIKARAHVVKKQAAENLEVLLHGCITGEITRQQIELSDELLAIYGRNKSKIEDALKVRERADATRKRVTAQQEFGTGWNKSAVVVHGARRSGKDTLTKGFLAELQSLAALAGHQWDVAKPPGKHALEAVGADALVHHEDARYYMVPDYDEMLRYLDPHNITDAAARYHKRDAPVARVSVMSTSNTLYEFGLTTLARKSTQELEEAALKGSRSPADIDEFLLRLAWAVEVQPPGFTVDDLLDQDYTKAEAFEKFCAEVKIGFYKPRERRDRRIEPVETRTGARLGRISTNVDLDLVGVIKGVARAARFLAVEVMHERNSDVVTAMPDDVAAALAEERGVIAGELEDHRADEQRRRNRWIVQAIQDYTALYERLYPRLPVEVPPQGPSEADAVYLQRLRGHVDELQSLESSKRLTAAANSPWDPEPEPDY